MLFSTLVLGILCAGSMHTSHAKAIFRAGLTRLRSLLGGRDNLPLHIFRLQQMAALVGHHPRECGGQVHAERSLTDFDLSQIESFLLAHQPLPFVLGV